MKRCNSFELDGKNHERLSAELHGRGTDSSTGSQMLNRTHSGARALGNRSLAMRTWYGDMEARGDDRVLTAARQAAQDRKPNP